MTEHPLEFEGKTAYDASVFNFRKVLDETTDNDIVQWVKYTCLAETNPLILSSYLDTSANEYLYLINIR